MIAAMPTLATTVDGLRLPNPFVIASGPPGTNLNCFRPAERHLPLLPKCEHDFETRH